MAGSGDGRGDETTPRTQQRPHEYTPADAPPRRTPTGEEAYRSVERNAREFAYYEGWDWEAAIEEEDTVLDDDTGERVHPMHYCDVAAADQQRTTGRRQRGERERGDDDEHTDAYGAKKNHSM